MCVREERERGRERERERERSLTISIYLRSQLLLEFTHIIKNLSTPCDTSNQDLESHVSGKNRSYS